VARSRGSKERRGRKEEEKEAKKIGKRILKGKEGRRRRKKGDEGKK
jgi:hypothetical protein